MRRKQGQCFLCWRTRQRFHDRPLLRVFSFQVDLCVSVHHMANRVRAFGLRWGLGTVSHEFLSVRATEARDRGRTSPGTRVEEGVLAIR